jgi:hypothetical protein
MQYSNDALDELIAPKLSELTQCGAPELPEFPNYRRSLFLNQLLSGVRIKEPTRILLNGFIARLAEASNEYRAARIFLERYVSALPQHNRLEDYWKSLMHFEIVILRLHLAMTCLGGAAKAFGVTANLIKKGDSSDYDRLRRLNNRIKHFDEDVEAALISNRSVPTTPLWITNDSIECSEAKLTFCELAAIFEAQTEDARYFSENFFDDVRKQKKDSGLGIFSNEQNR